MSPREEPDLEGLYLLMQTIRQMETQLIDLFQKGKLSGTIHTCIGQEACAVGVCAHLRPGDLVTSTHRGHGHYVAKTRDLEGLVGEVMGRTSGVAEGRGGSQHLCRPDFLANGITGGMVGVATGAAWGEKVKGQGNVVAAFFGEGALGQGLVWEALNLAALERLPILYVLENNGYAMSTHVRDALAGDIATRVRGFGLRWTHLERPDVQAIWRAAGGLVEAIRAGEGPAFLSIDTYRLLGHSKSDNCEYRTREEENEYRTRDPMTQAARALGPRAPELEEQARASVAEVVVRCHDHPLPDPAEVADGLFSPTPGAPPYDGRALAGKKHMRLIWEAIDEALGRDGAVLFGEDVADPYGGAFRVTAGLSKRHGTQKVRNTPISEAVLMATAVGMGLRGVPALTEVMFGDFIALCSDQIINHAGKFNWTAKGRMPINMTMRAPMGARRGYGPTHSQSLETVYAGVPGIKLVACSALVDSGTLLLRAVRDPNPVLLIENKLLYGKEFAPPVGTRWSADYYPWAALAFGHPEVTVAAYGGAADVALAALGELEGQGVGTELFVPSQISPLSATWVEGVCASATRTGALLIVEDSCLEYGLGAELAARAGQACWGKLRYPPRRLGAMNLPIPAQPGLEAKVLPQKDDLTEAVLALFE